MISPMALATSLPSFAGTPSMLAKRAEHLAWPRGGAGVLDVGGQSDEGGRVLRFAQFLPTAELVCQPQLDDGVDNDRMSAGAVGGE